MVGRQKSLEDEKGIINAGRDWKVSLFTTQVICRVAITQRKCDLIVCCEPNEPQGFPLLSETTARLAFLFCLGFLL